MKANAKTVTLAAAMIVLGMTSANSFDSADAAAAAGAKVCAAAPAEFPRGETLSVADLKERLAKLGDPLDGKNLEQLDSSCGVMTRIQGFAAMPMLHLGTNNRQDVAMLLQVSGRNGVCEATIISLDGC